MILIAFTLGMTALSSRGEAAQARIGMPAEPGERPDMPAVADRPYQADPDAGRFLRAAQFRDWARRNGNPRILLFWNVALTDESSTRTRLQARSATEVTAAPGIVRRSHQATIEDERTTGGPAAWIDHDENDALESGFVQAFIDADANLVDRAALMRKASTTRSRDDRTDLQFIEALAMEQGIDYLVEVLPDYSAGSKTGLTFGVRVVHVPSARVVTRFRSDGLPTAGPERLVARAGGFVRERDARTDPATIAAMLAEQTMQRFR